MAQLLPLSVRVCHNPLSTAEYTIHARYVCVFLAGAVARGHDSLNILKKAGLPGCLYSRSAGQIDGVQLQRLITAITQTLNDFFLGFMRQPQATRIAHPVAAGVSLSS